MERKINLFLVFILLLALIATGTACSSDPDVVDPVQGSSQERMLETISIMSAEDGGRIAGF